MNPADPNYIDIFFDIETHTGGFVIGESIIGETPVRQASKSWESIKVDFESVSISRSASQDNVLLWRPVASTAKLVTLNREYAGNRHYGKAIRITYMGWSLFSGFIKEVETSSVATKRGIETGFVLTATTDHDELLRTIYTNFTAPQESTINRLTRVWTKAALLINVPDNRTMPAISQPINASALDLLQEVADTNQARIYSDPTGKIRIETQPSEEPNLRFVYWPVTDDDATDCPYYSIDIVEDLSNVITQVTAVSKVDGSQATASHPGAVVTRAEKFEVNVIPSELQGWVDDFPLMPYTRPEPVKIRAPWKHMMSSYLELLKRVRINWTDGYDRTEEWECAVTSITHNITPAEWTVELGLAPWYSVAPPARVAPGPPRNFRVYTTQSDRIGVTWHPSYNNASLTNYVVRVKEGWYPPSSPTDGTAVATLGKDQLPRRATALGLKPNTVYTFSIWALTSNNLIYSPVATVTKTTDAV